MKLKPLHDNVVVKRDEAAGKSAGGIILPDTAKDSPRRGTVLAVGPGKLLETSSGGKQAMSVQASDRVIFSAYGGSEVELEGEKLLILSEKDILAVIQ